jgi:hypothetical protein
LSFSYFEASFTPDLLRTLKGTGDLFYERNFSVLGSFRPLLNYDMPPETIWGAVANLFTLFT